MSSKIRKDPSVSKQQRMVIDIIHTANWLDERISRFLKGYGITHPQFNILRNLQFAHPEPLSVKEIKDTIMFKNSDVTRLIDRLVNKELLNRTICPVNRRKVDVSITIEGIQLLESIVPELKTKLGNYFEDIIGLEEALQTSDLLRRIRK